MNWIKSFLKRFFKEEQKTSQITYTFGELEHIQLLREYLENELKIVDTERFEIVDSVHWDISFNSCKVIWTVRPKFKDNPPPPPHSETINDNTPGRASNK